MYQAHFCFSFIWWTTNSFFFRLQDTGFALRPWVRVPWGRSATGVQVTFLRAFYLWPFQGWKRDLHLALKTGTSVWPPSSNCFWDCKGIFSNQVSFTAATATALLRIERFPTRPAKEKGKLYIVLFLQLPYCWKDENGFAYHQMVHPCFVGGPCWCFVLLRNHLLRCGARHTIRFDTIWRTTLWFCKRRWFLDWVQNRWKVRIEAR